MMLDVRPIASRRRLAKEKPLIPLPNRDPGFVDLKQVNMMPKQISGAKSMTSFMRVPTFTISHELQRVGCMALLAFRCLRNDL
jgi:hypothetical protein